MDENDHEITLPESALSLFRSATIDDPEAPAKFLSLQTLIQRTQNGKKVVFRERTFNPGDFDGLNWNMAYSFRNCKIIGMQNLAFAKELNKHLFEQCQFINCSFVDIDEKDLTHCYFTNCVFTGKMFRAQFDRCNFTSKNVFRDIALEGVTFKMSMMHDTKLINFDCDSVTKFSECEFNGKPTFVSIQPNSNSLWVSNCLFYPSQSEIFGPAMDEEKVVFGRGTKFLDNSSEGYKVDLQAESLFRKVFQRLLNS
jgi:hypothetical protein